MTFNTPMSGPYQERKVLHTFVLSFEEKKSPFFKFSLHCIKIDKAILARAQF
jgi:hypothetical protein